LKVVPEDIYNLIPTENTEKLVRNMMKEVNEFNKVDFEQRAGEIKNELG